MCFGWQGRATTKVWLFFCFFWVFPGVIPGLQMESYCVGFEILVGFKNLGFFI